MPPASVEHCLEEFQEQTRIALKLGLAADKLYFKSQDEYEWAGLWLRDPLAEQGILRLRRSWEAFLECTFLRYLCGVSCASGYSPILLSPEQASIEAARNFLLGPNQNFLKWNRYATEQRAQNRFSQGAPFKTAVNSVWQKLEEIATLRNRFAHKSEHTRQEFHSLVRTRYGYLPRGISPGRFLLDTSGAQAGGDTRLEHYAKTLRGAANTIVR